MVSESSAIDSFTKLRQASYRLYVSAGNLYNSPKESGPPWFQTLNTSWANRGWRSNDEGTFDIAANSQQLEAITTTEGPLLIIAGPGSGKTFTLVERVISLLNEKGIAPERIMVVTFTDKAAQELTTRISNRLDELGTRFNLNEMYLGTLHSICLRWLQDHRECTRLKHNFTVFDEFDQHYFVYQHFSAFETLEGITHLAGNPATTSAWERSESLVKWINTVAEEALEIEILLAAPDAAIQALGRCAQLYYTLLEEQNALDFSTIQREALHLLRNYPSVRDALKERIAYVMVDEYQDFCVIEQC
jgi:DNA helicase-2/ATP-dependent DNA helicase PcrA